MSCHRHRFVARCDRCRWKALSLIYYRCVICCDQVQGKKADLYGTRQPFAPKVIALMAKGHTYLWQKPGRRDEERDQFSRLIAKVERIRVRDGLTQRAVAKEIGTTKDAVYNWISGRAIGRGESVAKIKDFLRRRAGRHIATTTSQEPG